MLERGERGLLEHIKSILVVLIIGRALVKVRCLRQKALLVVVIANIVLVYHIGEELYRTGSKNIYKIISFIASKFNHYFNYLMEMDSG